MHRSIKGIVFLILLGVVCYSLDAASSGVNLVGKWDEAAVKSVFVRGNIAYLICGNRLVALDISNKTAPWKVGEISIGQSPNSVYISGNYAYIANGEMYDFGEWNFDFGLRVIDISKPGAFKEIAFFNTQYSVQSVVVSGIYAYLGTSRNYLYGGYGKLDIVDISTPSAPQLKGGVSTGDNIITDVFLLNNYIYYSSQVQSSRPWNWGTFGIIDVSNPTAPQSTGGLSFAFAESSGITQSVQVSKNYAFAAHYGAYYKNTLRGLTIIDVSNPTAPRLASVQGTSGTAEDVFLSGDYAYIADGSSGLRVINISKPLNPSEAGFYETTGSAKSVYAAGKYVYLAADTEGFLVLELSDFLWNRPRISLEKERLNFGAVQGTSIASPSQGVWIRNRGSGTLNWIASRSDSWINISPASGSGDSLVNLGVNAGGVPVGTYTGYVRISDANATNSPQQIEVIFTVHKANTFGAPFGYFETPTDQAVVAGSIPVTGWVLHDIGVDGVKIYRKGLKGENSDLIYIGDAIFVEGARPDVEAAYPGFPMNSKAGWGYMLLTNFLPNGGNGTFTLHAVATSVSGQSVTLGTKKITCENANAEKPFGAIDTPAQGGMASGTTYINWGWVLTPQSQGIAPDGSTIGVYVDGWGLGHPKYNIFRSDIAGLFPGYTNSNGAGGFFSLDTTPYANGVHTIEWQVKDNAGYSDGIGSRYFTVQNSGSDSAQSRVSASSLLDTQPRVIADLSSFLPDSNEPVRLEKGYDSQSGSTELFPDEKGNITIESKELERLVIHLGRVPGGYSGYLVCGEQLKPLPVGSTFDAEKGILYWSPGPGFVGNYEFVFIDPARYRLRKIRVNILPKY